MVLILKTFAERGALLPPRRRGKSAPLSRKSYQLAITEPLNFSAMKAFTSGEW